MSVVSAGAPPGEAKDYGMCKTLSFDRNTTSEKNDLHIADLNHRPISDMSDDGLQYVIRENHKNEKICENGNLESFRDQNYTNSTATCNKAQTSTDHFELAVDQSETSSASDDLPKNSSDSLCHKRVSSPEENNIRLQNNDGPSCTGLYRNSVPQACGLHVGKSDQLENGVNSSQSENNIVHLRDQSEGGSRRTESYSRYISGAFQFLKEMDKAMTDMADVKIDKCEAIEKDKRVSTQGEELFRDKVETVTGSAADCETLDFTRDVNNTAHGSNVCTPNLDSAVSTDHAQSSDSVDFSEKGAENSLCESLDVKANSNSVPTCPNEPISGQVHQQNEETVPPEIDSVNERIANGSTGDRLSGIEKDDNALPGVEQLKPSSTQGSAEGLPQESDTKSTESPTVVKRRSTKNSVSSLKHQDLADKYGRQESVEGETDSSDEDSGVYAESHRNSRWIRVEEDGTLTLPTLPYTVTEEVDTEDAGIAPDLSTESKDDEVFDNNVTAFQKKHKRSDSNCTTTSEKEFQHKFRYLRKCSVQRKNSQQAFYRMSTRYYENEQVITLTKDDGNHDFGLHILDSHPSIISAIIPGSTAEKAGITTGQILISVNGVNVLAASHEEIIKLVRQNLEMMTLELGNSDMLRSRDLQTPDMSGYMAKLGSSGLIKLWRKRWFILRQDNCLYYYKAENDKDPLGAVPLSNYSVSKAVEMTRDYAFKLEKFGARTYFFAADSVESRKKWAQAMTVAAQSLLKIQSWMDVTSHNVGIPALSIRNPECTGYLSKLGQSRKGWRKRYCVLKDACIYYYKGISSYSAQGVAHLHGYSIENWRSKRIAFLLRPPEDQMRVFHFSTENDTDKQRWMDSMSKSIGRWKRLSNNDG